MAILVKPNSFNVSFFDEALTRRNLSRGKLYVVAYARLSYDEDGANFCSIINQRDILTSYYHSYLSNGTSSFEFIADDNVSGYKFEREGFFKLLELIERGLCSVIIAKDLSRIGRHGALVQLFIEQCERAGVRIIAMEDYDSHKQSDEMVLGIRTWSNERLVKDTSSKIRKIIDYKQKAGTWLCAVPYGYICMDFQSQSVKIDDVAAEVIHMIDRMYLIDDMGCKSIAKKLTDQEIPTPSQRRKQLFMECGKDHASPTSSVWSPGQIYKILSDDFYTGVLRTGKYTRRGINGDDVRAESSSHNVFAGHHEAIRSSETHKAIQEKMNRRRTGGFRATSEFPNIYRGLIKCGDCGSAMFVINDKRTKQHYACGNYMKLGKEYCSKHAIKTETLNCMAAALLSAIRDNCTDLLQSLDKELTLLKRSTKTTGQIISELTKQKESLMAEQEMIEIQRIKQITAHPEREQTLNELYDRMYDKNQSALDELSSKITDLENASKSFAGSAKEIKTAIGAIDSIISSGEITHADAELLFDEILVYNDGRVDIKLKPSISFISSPEIEVVDTSKNQPQKKYTALGINEVCEGDPLETSFILLSRRISAISAVLSQLRSFHRV